MSPGNVAEAAKDEQSERSLAVLCNEQTRIMLARNAANLSRIAAAISHELNTPLGALLSAVGTFESIVERHCSTADAKVAGVQRELLRTIRESADRLSDVVERMQRFTNLNRAEVQRTCLNDLIADVVSLIDPEVRSRVAFVTEFESALPRVVTHPQQLTAVFAMLLHRSIDSIDGPGTVRLVTRSVGRHVRVEIHDDGRGLPASALPHLFEPHFEERAGRIAAGDWNLFSCRHIVEAHGGELHLDSVEGRGTTVSIDLPAEPSANE